MKGENIVGMWGAGMTRKISRSADVYYMFLRGSMGRYKWDGSGGYGG